MFKIMVVRIAVITDVYILLLIPILCFRFRFRLKDKGLTKLTIYYYSYLFYSHNGSLKDSVVSACPTCSSLYYLTILQSVVLAILLEGRL